MENTILQSGAATLAVALAVGMVGQITASHLRIPGIVVLLGLGVLFGPDVLGVVVPERLGSALFGIVNFSVAIILFEGGLNLNLRRIRREQRHIQRLVTIGALMTAVLAATATILILGWDWRLAVLFGCLMIVTGPTVINPLLRRIRVHSRVGTVLEAEGLFGDATGAVLALVGMEVALAPTDAMLSPLQLITRLGGGLLIGLLGGGLLSFVFRYQGLVPKGLENVSALAVAVLLLEVSNALLPESGIAAVLVAGMVIGNLRPFLWRELHAFKEQLTVMVIGLLFVLLAANVRISELMAVGLPGLAVVAVLVFVIRPLAVFASTMGTGLTWREQAFIAWIGPRGIIAAAVASVFAQELADHDIAGGKALQALIFLTIALTVLVAGLSGRLVARLLGLERPGNQGWVILGAHRLAREIALRLQRSSEQSVTCIDADPENCRAAEAEGLHVIYGNALQAPTLGRATPERKTGLIALLSNDAINYLFAQRVRQIAGQAPIYIALERAHVGITREMLSEVKAELLFGRPQRLDRWNRRLEDDQAEFQTWSVATAQSIRGSSGETVLDQNDELGLILPVLIEQAGSIRPVTHNAQLRHGAAVTFLLHTPRREAAEAVLRQNGYELRAKRTELAIYDAPSEAAAS